MCYTVRAMTLTTHAAIGAAIGAKLGDPTLGFSLGVASHFLVDMIPHGDAKLLAWYRAREHRGAAVGYVSMDAAVAAWLIFFLLHVADYKSKMAFSYTIAGAVLPDVLVGMYDVTKHEALKPFVKLHFFFHNFFSKKYGDVKLRYALVGQAIFILLLWHWHRL